MTEQDNSKKDDNPDEEVAILLNLTRAEWSEITNAVLSKKQFVESGEYGKGEDRAADNKRWTNELDRIYMYLAKKLAELSIPY